MIKIVLLGATGGCIDVLNTINDINLFKPTYNVIGFLDDNKSLWGKEIHGILVLGGFSMALDMPSEVHFSTGIGSEKTYKNRLLILKDLCIPIKRFPSIIHPSAIISNWSKIENGVVVHQNSVINADSFLGRFTLVLPNSVINHGSKIGKGTIVNSHVSISGDVAIGETCYLGASCTLKQNIIIGDNALIGMGSVVINSVGSDAVVVGNPAKCIN
jgi:sugar O-acyltransferase (sialic acid O-acetyltransferase NeuD family)